MTTMIRESEHGMAFTGSTGEALEFVRNMREVHALAGWDMPQALNDLVFKIEVALQNAGILDEDFNLPGDVSDAECRKVEQRFGC